MEQKDISKFKERLMRRSISNSVTENADMKQLPASVTLVTKTKKIIQKIPKQNEINKNINHAISSLPSKFSSPLLVAVEDFVRNCPSLSSRPLKNDSVEQLDVTRMKPDLVDDNNLPVTAARLIFHGDGLVQFSLLTGKVEETQLDITKDLASEIELLLGKLSDSYCFCLGLPMTLPEIRCYPHPFQVSQDTPYKHVRSKDCSVWYQQSPQITVRERMGLIKPRCSACKLYFCRIARWCRSNVHITVDTTEYEKDNKCKPTPDHTETIHAKSSEVPKVSQRLEIKVKKRGRPPKRKNESPQKQKSNKNKAKDIQTEESVMLRSHNKSCQTEDTNVKNATFENEVEKHCFTLIKDKAVLLASVCSTGALYDASDDVVELTAGNFNNKVIGGDEVWLVEFYAPWCGHCRSLAPDWKKAATALKGIVRVGAVDMDVHGSVGGPYNVRGFPTIKIFGANKNSPQDYNGARSAQAIVDEALNVAKRIAKDRLSGGGSSRGSGGSGGSGGGSDEVVELTDANFEKEVFGTKDPVLVEFFAPWCGHCQRLAPEWKKAASELKGKVKVAALDATAHTAMASRFQVQGYPTIKVFRAGVKDFSSAEDYQGGRTASDIIAYALQLHAAAVEPPEVMELVSNSILADNCNEKPLCIVSFLPDILDTQAEGRNRYLKVLKELGEKYKAKLWGWVWTAGAVHGKLEQALGVGGFGYPAMAVVNIRKKVYVGLRGSFSYEGIDELLKSIAVGRGRTESLPNGLPTISDAPAWDGKDGKLPEEEDIDLSDIDFDDELDSDKKEKVEL